MTRSFFVRGAVRALRSHFSPVPRGRTAASRKYPKLVPLLVPSPAGREETERSEKGSGRVVINQRKIADKSNPAEGTVQHFTLIKTLLEPLFALCAPSSVRTELRLHFYTRDRGIRDYHPRDLVCLCRHGKIPDDRIAEMEAM